MCRHGTERKRRRLVVEETEERMGRVFSAYGTPLTAVPSFKYLWRTFSYSDNDWPEVEQNLQRERGKWGKLEKILGRERADRRTVWRFYVEVVQAVLLFGSDTWVLTPRVDKSFKIFN